MDNKKYIFGKKCVKRQREKHQKEITGNRFTQFTLFILQFSCNPCFIPFPVFAHVYTHKNQEDKSRKKHVSHAKDDRRV